MDIQYNVTIYGDIDATYQEIVAGGWYDDQNDAYLMTGLSMDAVTGLMNTLRNNVSALSYMVVADIEVRRYIIDVEKASDEDKEYVFGAIDTMLARLNGSAELSNVEDEYSIVIDSEQGEESE